MRELQLWVFSPLSLSLQIRFCSEEETWAAFKFPWKPLEEHSWEAPRTGRHNCSLFHNHASRGLPVGGFPFACQVGLGKGNHPYSGHCPCPLEMSWHATVGKCSMLPQSHMSFSGLLGLGNFMVHKETLQEGQMGLRRCEADIYWLKYVLVNWDLEASRPSSKVFTTHN